MPRIAATIVSHVASRRTISSGLFTSNFLAYERSSSPPSLPHSPDRLYTAPELPVSLHQHQQSAATMSSSDRIRMSSIQALTLHRDRLTTARRSSPVPQLTCRGKQCRSFEPRVVQCLAMGEGSDGMEWKCEADLPNSIKFGSVEVSCEGWTGPSDPYVLKGSCGLTYDLVGSSSAYDNDDYYRPSSSSEGISFTTLLWIAAAVYIIYSYLNRAPAQAIPRGASPFRRFFGGWGGGGGGGGGGEGGGGGGAPPPPYSKDASNAAAPAPAAAGFQPGFWTGLAGGALGAAVTNSFFGNNNNNQRNNMYNQGYGNGGGWGNGGGGGMFGGGGGGYGGGNRNGGGGGGTSTSTGFGGTRNR